MEENTPESVEPAGSQLPRPQPGSAGRQRRPGRSRQPTSSPTADKPAKAKASALVKEAQAYITELFAKELPAKLTYHTLRHTEAVVKECRALAPAAELSARRHRGAAAGRLVSRHRLPRRVRRPRIPQHGAGRRLAGRARRAHRPHCS